MPLQFQTRVERGCPWDCGLCPDHEQHSCLALIEVTNQCNLNCPVCFAKSGPDCGPHRTLAEVEAMLDTLVASEGKPDLVQISGGEPTIHPQIMEILRAAKARPIRHLMLNTNGIRLASDPDFVAELASLKPGFEVYLQFDSLRREALEDLRGADLRKAHEKALANLDAHNISTTLVATIKKGVNDGEAGDIIRHGLSHPCVRGVSFQPIQDAGRVENFDKSARMTVSEIRRAIIDRGDLFGEDDIIPLPCNPQAISVGYALRKPAGGAVAVTGLLPRDVLLQAPNAITFEGYPELRAKLLDLLSLSCNGENTARLLGDLLCCLPQVELPANVTYDAVFRVSIAKFLDRFDFSLGEVKRSCVHVVTPGGKIIPIDTYNLFHREDLNEH
jgi:7,8-dihydro-6-hydroxymethylpterin dimethyltransferase